MCIAIPAKIIECKSGTDLATADVIGITRQINVGLLGSDSVEIGDWVLIHSGFAMSKIDEAEARVSLEFLGMLASSDPMNSS